MHQCGLQGKYASDPEFKLRAKMLSAIAFLPVEDAVEGFEMMGPLFENNEQDLLAYFERTYVGRRDGAGWRHPLFRIDLRNVRSRMGAVALRANNADESLRDGSPSGVAVGRPPVWALVESTNSPRNITDKDMVGIERGGGEGSGQKRDTRNDRIWKLAGGIWKIGGALRLLRGVWRNYL